MEMPTVLDPRTVSQQHANKLYMLFNISVNFLTIWGVTKFIYMIQFVKYIPFPSIFHCQTVVFCNSSYVGFRWTKSLWIIIIVGWNMISCTTKANSPRDLGEGQWPNFWTKLSFLNAVNAKLIQLNQQFNNKYNITVYFSLEKQFMKIYEKHTTPYFLNAQSTHYLQQKIIIGLYVKFQSAFSNTNETCKRVIFRLAWAAVCTWAVILRN